MTRRTIGILASVGVVAVIGSIVAWIILSGAREPAAPLRLSVRFPELSVADDAFIARLLQEFDQFHDSYEIDYEFSTYPELVGRFREGETADLTLLSASDLGFFDSFDVPPIAWTGSAWGLYYHRPTIDRLGIDIESLVSLPWPEFHDFLLSLEYQDHPPISVGARLGWPWLSWLQHLAVTFGSASSPEAIESALPAWREIEAAGLVNPDYRSISWAESVQRVVDGKALFVLFDATALRPLLPAERALLEFRPFPGSRTADRPWQIGSILYLAAPQTGSSHGSASAGGALVAYLTSEGVSTRLRRETGLEIYSTGVAETNFLLIPSITSDPRNARYRALVEAMLEAR